MTNKRAPSQARALHGYVPPGPCPCAFLPTPDRRADAVVAAGLGHGCAGRGLLEHGDFRSWPSYGAGVRDSGARGNVGSFVVPSPADAPTSGVRLCSNQYCRVALSSWPPLYRWLGVSSEMSMRAVLGV